VFLSAGFGAAAHATVRPVTNDAGLTAANSAALPGDTIMVAAGTYNVRPVPARDGTANGVIAYVGNPGNPSSVIFNNSPSDGGATARSFVSWDGFYCKEDWGFFGSQSLTGTLDSLRIARCILEEGGGIRRAYRSGYYACVIGVFNKPDRSMYVTGAGQNNYIKRCLMRLQIPDINLGNDILKFDWSVSNPTGEYIRSFVCDSNVIEVKITGTACVDTTNYETLTRGIKIRGVRQSSFRYNRITISDSTTGSCVGATKVGFWMRDYADSNIFLADTIVADGGNNSSFRFDITNDGNGSAGFPRYNTYSQCLFMNLSRCYATRRLEGLYWRGGMNYATIDSCSFVNGPNAGSMSIATMAGDNRLVHNNFVALGGRPALDFVCTTCTGANTTFRNNILYSQPGPPAGLAPLSLSNIGAMSQFDSDYNLYTNLSQPAQALTYSGVAQAVGPGGPPCTNFGRDCHSISFSPGFVDSTAASYNPQLLPWAKPIGAGENQRTIGVKQYPPGQTLVVTPIGAGTVVKVPDQISYDFGALVVLTATPTFGYHFVGWSGDATGNTNPLAVLMDGNKSITATFAINTYTVAATAAGNGTVTKSPNLAGYDHGSTVQLTASPSLGYHFVGWSGDTTGTANPFNVTLHQNKSYTATFAINTYAVSISTAGSGTLTKNPDQPTYDHGSSVQLTATPGLGYHLAGWSGDTTGTANPFTVVLHQNRSYTATFAINTYAIATGVVGSGTVMKTPDLASYDHGASVQITAIPNPGYHFLSWSGDTTGASNPFTVITNQNRSYTATFAINTYAVSTAVVGTGTVSRSPDQATYEYGSSVQLTAAPGFGHHFVGWSGDTTGTANPFNVTLHQNKSYTATFAINTYAVTAGVVGNGTVTKTPDQPTYDHGSSVQLTATPDPGYHFLGWSGDTTGTMNPFTKIMNGNKSYTATFAINSYALSVSTVGSGSVTKNPDLGSYPHGTSVELTAVPGTGHHFLGWSGDTIGTANPFTGIMNGNRSYTATFAINSYTLSVGTVGSGSVTKDPDLGSYPHGTSVQLTAVPDAYYSFTGWSGDTTGSMNPFTMIMNGNKSYTATFTINSYTLSVSTVGNGSVTRNPDQPTYPHGTSVELTAVPGTGYSFTGWSGDTTGTINPFTRIMNGNKNYTATFAINTYTLSTAVVGSGSVTKNPDLASYAHGASVELTAVPSTGYSFTGWSGDTTGTMNPFTKIMNGSKSYTATFAINTYTLSTAVVGSGSVALNPTGGTYDHGTSVQLTATPSFGYSFTGWSGDTTGAANPFTVILHQNKSYTATFALNAYTVSTAAIGSGTVTRSPSQATYDHGTSVQLTASPSFGYTFTGWSGDTTGTANPFSVILHQNKSYTATFTLDTYTVTTSVVGSGTVTKNPDQASYTHGSSVQLTATPSFGYSFIGWSGDTTGTASPFTVILHQNKSYTAAFTISTYTIATSVVGSGTVTKNPNQATYDHGTSVQVTANPSVGYSFTGWSGDTTGTTNPFTVILHEDRTFTATFTINSYTMSVSTVGNGSVTKNPDLGSYPHGTSVELTAVPGTGYSFTGWGGDTTGTMNPFSRIMNGNRSYTATFTINSYTLAVSTVGSGSVTRNPDLGSYAHGTSVELTAVPDAFFSFTGWSGDTTGAMNPITTIMNGNKSYTATFGINSYTLSVSTVGSGSVTRNPDLGSYPHGTSVELTAVPGTGYSFTGWSGDTTGTMNPFTKIVNGNKSYTATFTINSYTLGISTVGGGSVTRNPDLGSYPHGTSVELTAVPGIGYSFTGWSGDTTGTMNPFTRIMNGNRSYTATFTINSYTLAVSTVGSGSVTRNPDLGSYLHGTSVELTAVPDAFYSFAGWSGDTTGSMNPFTRIMNGNRSYTATFTINSYTLSVSTVGNGSVTKNPDLGSYPHGTSVELTAVSGTGYSFTGWSGDTTGTMNPFTRIMNGNRSYSATFTINSYTLSVSTVGSGSVIKNPDLGSYPHGTSVELAAVPGAFYSFTGWSGDTTGTMNPFTRIMNGNKSYTATFTINSYSLSVSTVGNGSVTRNPDLGSYPHGTSVELTAVPGTGYSFTGWSGDTTGTMNPFTKIMNGNRSYTATFTINSYTLSVSTVGNGSVNRNPDLASYPHGTSVELTAVPGTGYGFTAWSGDTTGTMNPFTRIMNGNRSYTATFTINSYTLSVSTVGSGSVTRNPDLGSYPHGTSVELAAVPGAFYSFTGWSGDTTGTMNPFTKIMDGSRSYTATFTINSYTLSVSTVGSGSVTRNPDQPTYPHGTSVELTAVPGTGYSFTGWSGDTTSTMNPFTRIMNGDRSYTATFTIRSYALTVTIVGNGTVTRDPDLPLYTHGSEVELTATAGPNHYFSGWTGDSVKSLNPLSLVMTKDMSLTAHFNPIPVAVQLPPRFLAQAFATDLNYPVGMAFLPDGRLLYVEKQTARIRMIANGGPSLVDPVGVVDSVAGSGAEDGLLGVAVDPGWPLHPHIYVCYTALGGTIRLSRLTAEGDLSEPASSDLAFPSVSRRDILRDLPNQSPIHNGGAVRFGPDGMLYLSLGDDMANCEEQNPAQLVGAVLRLDVSGVADGPGEPPDRGDLVPPDNPYAIHPDTNRRLVWAAGFRNPFRFHIDPANGSIFVSDVGEDTYEEIDLIAGAGLNYGWPSWEGPGSYSSCSEPGTMEPPIHWYDRTGFAASVMGAGVYRGSGCATCDFPAEYEGDYFFSDYYEGFLRRLHYSGGVWSMAEPVPGQPSATDWGRGFDEVSDYLVGPDGALWYCRMSVNYADGTGEIGRIHYQSATTAVGNSGVADGGVSFALPYPSPSRGNVSFAYAVGSPSRVELAVYDAMGRLSRRLVSADQGAGRHVIAWDGRNVNGSPAASGVYLARLMVNGRPFMRRLVLTR